MADSKRVMGFGTFDGVHPGHLSYFKQLRDLGDELFLVIARDQSVKKIKGRAARLSEQERFKAVQETGLVDEVLMGDLEDHFKVIQTHKPDVIGLGYDQRTDEEALQKAFPTIKVIRLESFYPEKYKSSLYFGE